MFNFIVTGLRKMFAVSYGLKSVYFVFAVFSIFMLQSCDSFEELIGTADDTASNEYTEYQVKMDEVESADWAYLTQDVGDLYVNNNKQVDMTYRIRNNWGNAEDLTISDSYKVPQFWQSTEYGKQHKAIFITDNTYDGSWKLEIEIAGLNGNKVTLSQLVLGNWIKDNKPDALESTWRIYDGNWKLLKEGVSSMVDSKDYSYDFDFSKFSKIYIQLGKDNWDNGIISFSYKTGVADGVLDIRNDNQDSATPEIEGSQPR